MGSHHPYWGLVGMRPAVFWLRARLFWATIDHVVFIRDEFAHPRISRNIHPVSLNEPTSISTCEAYPGSFPLVYTRLRRPKRAKIRPFRRIEPDQINLTG